MDKVYIVYKYYDNGCEYEDFMSSEEILAVCETKEVADNFIKNWMPEDISASADEEKARLEKIWNELSEEEKEDWEEGFDEYFSLKSRYITSVTYNEEACTYGPGEWKRITIPKVIRGVDNDYYSSPIIRLIIIEKELLRNG